MNLRKPLLAVAVAATLPVICPTANAAAELMAAPVNQASPQESASLVAKLTALDSERGLSADNSFRISSQHPGVVGQKITRVQHTYKGLRVFGSESVVVTNTAGDIVSESVSDRRAGLAGNQSVVNGTKGDGVAPALKDLTPSLSSGDAIALVVKQVAPSGVHRWAPQAELLIWPVVKSVRVASALNKSEAALNALDLEDVVDHYELAYYVQTRMADKGKVVYHDTIVNAKTGAIIAQWKSLQTVVGTGNSQYNGSVPINTTLSGSTYKMLDATRGTGGVYGGMAITNANHSSADSPNAGSIYTNSTNTWGDGKQYISGGSTTNANGQTAAVNALWGLMNTYDTLKSVLGWQSLDGNNTATYIAAHVDNNYDNAFFDPSCKCMYIGDGSSFTSLGSIDVIGHEMSHGVTDATSNLTYSGESGGLNESNSDIGGEMVEAYARNGGTGTVIPAGNDWMMGKEISKSGQPLRWMWKPSKDGSSPDAWSSTIKNLDVHYSSGPNNRMFYFLSQGSNSSASSEYYSKYLTKSPAAMTGIGNDKAYRIWFKAATTKFTASTNYADARTKVLAAAQELYGVGSKEAIAVQRAYAAINVGTDIDEAGGTGGVSISTQPANVSVAAGATASFSVGATGGTAPYSYKWYRNGAAISGATSATYSLTAQTADNGATFYAIVSDASSPAKTATSNSATLTVGGGGGTGTERVTNGGFESGTTGWGGTTGVIGNYSGQTAYEGTKFAWLGGNGKAATETLTQSVAIPSAATSASLSFALHIDTAETDNVAYDKLVVTVKNSSGTVLGTLATYTNLNAASGYQVRTFNLLPYKGQTVTLSFAMTEDSALQTSFVVDKVSLITQ
ncbi:Zn-dependent metalloprotease [Duganella sacchari]|uniref:Zn-dependent metalloprotease n=1 Tax=Duganella sacchari TaxID=551987 RepID=A0A1M7QA62_9BURK|nr:M4 family metallopeptidase [Duganella sacchari]SHN27374.1 Zn-dependent metalloprotease [Duganella sacchari]